MSFVSQQNLIIFYSVQVLQNLNVDNGFQNKSPLLIFQNKSETCITTGQPWCSGTPVDL